MQLLAVIKRGFHGLLLRFRLLGIVGRGPAVINLGKGQIILVCDIRVCEPIQCLLRLDEANIGSYCHMVLLDAVRLCPVTGHFVDSTGAVGSSSAGLFLCGLLLAAEVAEYRVLRDFRFAFFADHLVIPPSAPSRRIS